MKRGAAVRGSDDAAQGSRVRGVASKRAPHLAGSLDRPQRQRRKAETILFCRFCSSLCVECVIDLKHRTKHCEDGLYVNRLQVVARSAKRRTK